jgi:hypothetical protein
MELEYRRQKIPERISALAESCQLGVPIKVYRRLLYVVMMYVSIALFAGIILASVMFVRSMLDELALFNLAISHGWVQGDLKVKLVLERLFLERQMPWEVVMVVGLILSGAGQVFTFYLL